MNVSCLKKLNDPRSINFKEGQSFLLTAPTLDQTFVSLSVEYGISRISTTYGDNLSDVTLAFCGSQYINWIALPNEFAFVLEALSDSQINIQYSNNYQFSQDLIAKWLFDLHFVRHPIGAEARLIKLFQLLVTKFGEKKDEGTLLPFSLSHSRIAELIGSTRSTVTRQISLLRSQNYIYVNDYNGRFFLSDPFLEYIN